MINSEMENFFESLLTAVKWKYSEAEQLIIFDKLPHKISAGILLEKAVLKFGSKKPTGKQLINFAWDLVKKHKIKIKQQVLEGCNNCVDGYIKVVNLKAYTKQSEEDRIKPIPTNIINLFEMTHYASMEVYCNCTNEKNNISKYLKELIDIQFTLPDLYEFVYVTLYAYAKMWLSEKRFADFDKFNPYEVWTTSYDPGVTMKRSECKNYGYVIDQEFPTAVKTKAKKMLDPVSYNKTLYEE